MIKNMRNISINLLLLLLSSCSAFETVSSEISRYDELKGKTYKANEFMPSLSAFPSTCSFKFSYRSRGYHDKDDIGTLWLTVAYPSEEFASAQKKWSESFVYADDTNVAAEQAESLHHSFAGSYGSFYISLVYLSDFMYPDEMPLFGIDESENRLGFLYFADSSIDYIEDIEQLLKGEFSDFK
jgi:hypothetical protein